MIFINTRPQHRAKNLSNFLQNQGFSVLDLPLLELVKCKLDDNDTQKLAKINDYKHIILVSETAVDYFLQNFHQKDLQALAKLSFIAVGQKTAEIFTQKFFAFFGKNPNIITPQDFNFPENNEGMLQLPAVQTLQNSDKILIIKGKDGRELLKNTLENRQIIVDTIDFYERIFDKKSEMIFKNFIKNWQKNDKKIVLISSMTAWQFWQNLLKNHQLSENDFAYIVLQNRIANTLTERNIQQVFVVDDLNNQTILTTIKNCLTI